MGKEDVVVIDKLVHACVLDAVRLSAARLRVYGHNDLNSLERILKSEERKSFAAGERKSGRNLLIVTESVFSMDGDRAPLGELVALKERYGAWLMVDEAHATGLYGENGSGLAEHAGLNDRIEIQLGTLGKAIGAAGGYVCGSRELIDYLINHARPFIFSTAPAPATAGAARAGVELVQSKIGRERRRSLWQRIQWLAELIERDGNKSESAIVPLHMGEAARATAVAAELRAKGFFVPAIRYPSVPRGKARLRITLSAAHEREQIAGLVEALSGVGEEETGALAGAKS